MGIGDWALFFLIEEEGGGDGYPSYPPLPPKTFLPAAFN